jgi:thiosulfate/3-mercaptopyruvate sulfurtransferase
VQDAIEDPGSNIVDVRTDSEFRDERFWPSGGPEPAGRTGHVPSALNVSIEGLRDEHGSFRSAADLRRVFASIDPSDSGEVMAYCTIGARACTAWFALTYLLGRQRVRVYDGSWAEWGLTPGTLVESAVSP